MNDPLRELERLNAVVLAAEGWAPAHEKAPKSHAAMIKQAAVLQRKVLEYLRDLAKEAPSYVDWYAYARAVIEQKQAMHGLQGANVQAYDVNVIVNKDAVSQSDQQFIKIVFDTVATIQSLGADSMEEEFGAPIGLSPTSTIIQELTTKQLANLVGMRVQKDGTIVPNPNPAYQITDTTRNKIAQSIKNSIQLGKNQQEAAKALQDVIADPARADLIAYTETVRGYAEGRAEYARQSNASGKYWSDRSAIDICADNAGEGIIPIDEDFLSGDPNEPAHPRCQCLVVYVYGDLASAGDGS